MRSPLTQFRSIILVLVSAFALGACATDQASEPAGGSQAAAFNEADIAFMQSMIQHHSQAVEMAQLVGERAAHEELNQLASTIIADQTREIDTMTGLLAAAGAPSSRGGMQGMGHGGMEMPGMAGEPEVAALRSLDGEPFDLRFLALMTAHHEGAIEMAEQVLQDGENPQLADLARGIVEAQRAEIQQMAAWREEWTTR
ncbi:MAG: DUF305 domain-containing protein [Egibacteraceae bacterium]